MPTFPWGKLSLEHRAQLHPDLILVVDEVANYINCTIVTGSRSLENQALEVARGNSKTMNSMHLLRDPKTSLITTAKNGVSWAADLTPYPFDWNAKDADRDLLYFGGFVVGVARKMGIKIRYGGDWNGDWKNSDNGFQDLDHFEKIL